MARCSANHSSRWASQRVGPQRPVHVELEALVGGDGGDVVDDRRGLLGAAELPRVRLGDGHRRSPAAPSDRAGTAGRRSRSRRRSRVVGELVDRGVEAALADVAPRADDVGPDLDELRHRLATGRRRDAGATVAGRWSPARDRIVGGVTRAPTCRRRSAPRSSTSGSRHGVAPRRRRAGLAEHADGAGADRRGRAAPCTSSTTSGRRRSSPSASGSAATPAVLLCTSGTAAANFHPAVVEAGLSDVPMLVLTADRPPELRDVGAPQTIDQTAPVRPRRALVPRPRRRRRRRRGHVARRSPRAPGSPRRPTGPVHLNLPFREPLVGAASDRCRRADGRRVRRRRRGACPTAATRRLVELLRRPRGVIVAGGAAASTAGRRAARRRPPAGRCSPTRRRAAGTLAGAVAAVRRHAAPRAVRRRASSRGRRAPRPTGGVEGAGPVARRRPARPSSRSADPASSIPTTASSPRLDAGRRCRLSASRAGGVGHDRLARRLARRRRRTAEAAIDAALGDRGAAHRAGRRPHGRPARSPTAPQLVVASSMPVRDLEWFGGPHGASAHANRGANGIDGVVSTAIGVALGGGAPTVVLLGDIAFVHDASALIGLAAAGRRPGDRRRRQRRRRHLLVPPAGDAARRRHASSSCSARPTAPTSSRSPAAHGLDAATVDDGRRAGRPRSHVSGPVGHPCRHRPGRQRASRAHAPSHAAPSPSAAVVGRPPAHGGLSLDGPQGG